MKAVGMNLNATKNCKMKWNRCGVKSDPGSRKGVYVSEWDDVTRDDVDTAVKAAKISLPSISVRSPPQQTSRMSERG